MTLPWILLAAFASTLLSSGLADTSFLISKLENEGFTSFADALDASDSAKLFVDGQSYVNGILLAPTNAAVDQAYRAAINNNATDDEWNHWFSQIIGYHYLKGPNLMEGFFCKDWYHQNGRIMCVNDDLERRLTVFAPYFPGGYLYIGANYISHDFVGVEYAQSFMAETDAQPSSFTEISQPKIPFSDVLSFYKIDAILVPRGFPSPAYIHGWQSSEELDIGTSNMTVL